MPPVGWMNYITLYQLGVQLVSIRNATQLLPEVLETAWTFKGKWGLPNSSKWNVSNIIIERTTGPGPNNGKRPFTKPSFILIIQQITSRTLKMHERGDSSCTLISLTSNKYCFLGVVNNVDAYFFRQTVFWLANWLLYYVGIMSSTFCLLMTIKLTWSVTPWKILELNEKYKMLAIETSKQYKQFYAIIIISII